MTMVMLFSLLISWIIWNDTFAVEMNYCYCKLAILKFGGVIMPIH